MLAGERTASLARCHGCRQFIKGSREAKYGSDACDPDWKEFGLKKKKKGRRAKGLFSLKKDVFIIYIFILETS